MTNNQVMQQALEALEALDHPDGCKSGYAKDTGEGVWFNEMWPEKCDCGRNAAIEALRSALAQQPKFTNDLVEFVADSLTVSKDHARDLMRQALAQLDWQQGLNVRNL